MDTNLHKFGFVLNYREKHYDMKDLKSRGDLIPLWFNGKTASEINELRNQFGGFNLIIGDDTKMQYVGNRNEKSLINLEPSKLYGISNGHFLQDSEWPKVSAGISLIEKALETCETREKFEDELLRVLQNEDSYPDHLIPKGYDAELEKTLCSICIDKSKAKLFGKDYGTRTNAVITIKDGICRIIEVDRYDYDSNVTFPRVDVKRSEQFAHHNSV
jgi:uncharacterized protein with NRDE domain